jgi:hypothetical protein
MKTWRHHEKIKRYARDEANNKQSNPRNTKRKPQYEKKVNVWNDKPV